MELIVVEKVSIREDEPKVNVVVESRNFMEINK